MSVHAQMNRTSAMLDRHYAARAAKAARRRQNEEPEGPATVFATTGKPKTTATKVARRKR